MTLAPGTRLASYEVVALIGQGAMGEVYRARDPRLRRDVAIKILRSSTFTNEERLRRFEQEARTAGMLNHPNLPAIYELGVHDGASFIVSELLEGESLRARLNRGPLAAGEALDIAVQIARGLTAAHAKGIVHRDLKPENIFLTGDGFVKILDFGLAKLTDSSGPDSKTVSQITEPGRIMGTFAYMSPEQATGGSVDMRSDLFSLGSILYEMLCGRFAFAGQTAGETVAMVLSRDPLDPPPKEIAPPLVAILRRCLAKHSSQRFSSAHDVALALEAAKSGTASGSWDRAPIRRRRVLALVIAIIVLGTIGFAFFKRSSSPPAPKIASIAVLPLVDLSGDKENAYFADGMTEELIMQLAQIKALRVIAPASVARYKNTTKPLRQIADELNVQRLIAGSVSRANNTIRVNAQLIDPQTEQTLWASRYERPIQDEPTLQNDIARSIADQIAVNMTPIEQKRLAGAGTIDPQVHDLYLKGLAFYAKDNPEGLSRAMAYFREVIDQEPAYAPAHASLANSYNTMALYGVLIPSDAFPRAKEEALAAIRLDPQLGEAHVPLAFVYSAYEWDWPRAEAEYRRALELNPNYDVALEYYALHLLTQGRVPEAIEQVEKRLTLNPVSWNAWEQYGWVLYYGHRYDEAVVQYKKALEINPDDSPTLEGLADVYAMAGRNNEAVEQYDAWAAVAGLSGDKRKRLIDAYSAGGMHKYWETRLTMELAESAESGDYWPFRIASYYARLENRDKTFEWLEKAYEERNSRMTLLDVNPVFDSVRNDPRFAALLRKVGLPIRQKT